MVPLHRRYGARPAHLALLLACFALAGYAAQQPYLGRWLWLVAALFAASALVYGARLLLTRPPGHDGGPPAGAVPERKARVTP
jgi:hypothetical protein